MKRSTPAATPTTRNAACTRSNPLRIPYFALLNSLHFSVFVAFLAVLPRAVTAAVFQLEHCASFSSIHTVDRGTKTINNAFICGDHICVQSAHHHQHFPFFLDEGSLLPSCLDWLLPQSGFGGCCSPPPPPSKAACCTYVPPEKEEEGKKNVSSSFLSTPTHSLTC